MNQKTFHASKLRRTVLDMAYAGSAVHIGCAFSIIELLAVLYRSHLRLDASHPRASDRDYLVLSKGHGVMAQYACLLEKGVLEAAAIAQYFKDGTQLKGLADSHTLGVEASCGSLGHGLPVATGLALAIQRKKMNNTIYALVGDGELNEGSIWEAVMFATHFCLDNLIVIVDRNGFQAMGTTDEVMTLGNIEAKFHAFGFDVESIDGHDENAIDAAYSAARLNRNGRPKAIVANTIKGKGVHFMERDNRWHYTRLTSESYADAVGSLSGETG